MGDLTIWHAAGTVLALITWAAWHAIARRETSAHMQSDESEDT